MTRVISAFWLSGVFCLFLVGCASGPTYSSMRSELPVLRAGVGRIFIYRSSGYVPDLGGAIGLGQLKIDIFMDGLRVGRADPGCFFFVDLAPGTHLLSCDDQTTRMNLVAGESRYVSLEVYTYSRHHHLRPILVHPAQGSQEILGLHYPGRASGGATDATRRQPPGQ